MARGDVHLYQSSAKQPLHCQQGPPPMMTRLYACARMTSDLFTQLNSIFTLPSFQGNNAQRSVSPFQRCCLTFLLRPECSGRKQNSLWSGGFGLVRLQLLSSLHLHGAVHHPVRSHGLQTLDLHDHNLETPAETKTKDKTLVAVSVLWTINSPTQIRSKAVHYGNTIECLRSTLRFSLNNSLM